MPPATISNLQRALDRVGEKTSVICLPEHIFVSRGNRRFSFSMQLLNQPYKAGLQLEACGEQEGIE